jgi:hypothetical protein
MTKANMERHAKSEWAVFWRTLKEGYDYFELTRQVPTVAVCNRRYVVNVRLVTGGDPAKINPAATCPAFLRPRPSPFTPPKTGKQHAQESTVAPGPRMGLTKAPAAGSAWWREMLDGFGLGDKTGGPKAAP